MTERKALTRYYPLDYNPEEEDRSAKRQRKHGESSEATDATNRMRIRMALPMHVVCDTCGNLIGEGRRFNAFKETLRERNYLGLKIYRFIIKCPGCSANFTLLTSPETSGYKCERLCHAIGQSDDGGQQAADQHQEPGDDETTVQKLERKAQENRAEMDMIEAIEKMKDLNQKHLRLRSEGAPHQQPKAVAAPPVQRPKTRALQLFDLPQFEQPDPHTCVLSVAPESVPSTVSSTSSSTLTPKRKTRWGILPPQSSPTEVTSTIDHSEHLLTIAHSNHLSTVHSSTSPTVHPSTVHSATSSTVHSSTVHSSTSPTVHPSTSPSVHLPDQPSTTAASIETTTELQPTDSLPAASSSKRKRARVALVPY